MDSLAVSISENIPGVFVARQKRSVRIRDAFINAGVEALNGMRFSDLRVSDLATNSGNSVGSFYTRFRDKDAFFRALGAFTIESLDREIIERFTDETLSASTPNDGLEMLVDLLADIFTSRFRGVLRESLLRILEPDDPWAPMRGSASKIIAVLHSGMGSAFPEYSDKETKIRLSFCFQIIVGVLQNDLVNDYHVFSTRDQSIRKGLKEAVCSYMKSG